MNKKGFTLVELLAVIMILGIIALIAIPTVSILIEDSKKKAAEVSALHYLKAIEDQNALAKLLPEKYTPITSGDVNEINVNIKGDLPKEGTVTIENGKVTGLTACIGGYNVTYDGSKTTVGSRCGSAGETEPSFVEPTATDTHKGIVYLDPTDLDKKCTASTSVSTTETKTGCMKWYIYDDSGNTYKMILDHNTTARTRWYYGSDKAVAYESSNVKEIIDDLVTTSGWQATPRIISAQEVNTLVGGPSTWDVSNRNTFYYFGTLTQTVPTFSETVRSSYDWLYNNLPYCKSGNPDYGCTIEDNNNYLETNAITFQSLTGQPNGYWTSTPIGTAGSATYMWCVYRFGSLSYNYSNNGYMGVRPVIELSKSLFE